MQSVAFGLFIKTLLSETNRTVRGHQPWLPVSLNLAQFLGILGIIKWYD